MPRPIDPPVQDTNNQATYGGNTIPPEPPGMVDPFFDAVSRQWKDRYVSTQDPEPAAPPYSFEFPTGTPEEPVSPFEKYLMALENLQPPVEFFPNSYQEPSAPAFTPMAAPAAVRVSPPAQFGPVTPSGYAQPPVDPLSYYSDPEIIPETPLVGDPVELNTFKLSAIPTPGIGTTLDPVTEDRYGIKGLDPKDDIEEKGSVVLLTDKEVEDLIGDQTPTPPAPPQDDVLVPWKYNVVRDVITTNIPKAPIPKPYQFKEYPTKTPTEITRIEEKIIPFKMPTEVPIPARRAAELLAPGYSQDINYDPDEILAAAMRVIRGRSAGRSLMY